ncbi:MAG: response regulator, partial [Magnetococcales bacterium]|nr:response regulator [Magnetococcales bacterium]
PRLLLMLGDQLLRQLHGALVGLFLIEAGKLTMEDAGFTLDEVLGGVVAILSVKSHEKGLELLLDTRRNVPHNLRGDSHRLGQILTNLVGNAIKFTEKGEVSIITEALEETQDDVFLRFTVRDTGIGMTPEQMSKLFQEFSQGDTSITRKYGGTGLGLAISKRLVEMMGGQIGVTNDPGRGSRFTFTARFGKVGGLAPELLMPAESIRGLHILVVDDNAGARQIISEHLASLAYQPVCAESGARAIDELLAANEKGSPFDLVLLDWKMPGLNGLEVARHIKKGMSLKKNPIIIMVTAYGQEYIAAPEEEKNLLDGFLMKPVNITSMVDVIMIAFGHEPARQAMRCSNIHRANLAGVKLLLVEDNEINQQVARELLEQAGIMVEIAKNGLEAVNLVSQNHFDGVLMDLQMPVMDGLTATRQIRKKLSADELPIIAMTANAMAGDREKCLEAGMNDHIAKPVDPEEMYATLAKWLEHRPGLISQPSVVPPFGHSMAPVLPLPPIPGIDIAKGLRNIGGNTVLYRHVLLKFAHNQGGACQEMERCLASGNIMTLERIAHTLKGVSATIGASKLANLAEQIEKQSKIQHGLEDLPKMFGTTASELARIVSTIETTLMPLEAVTSKEDQPGVEIGLEDLSLLFQRAVALLLVYDASVDVVLTEIAALTPNGQRRKNLETIKLALDQYDYEACLTLFRAWAKEEGVHLDK